MYRKVGTCSICGGAVVVPEIWHGIFPPTPSCSQCKAIPVEPHGPVIPMQPAPKPRGPGRNGSLSCVPGRNGPLSYVQVGRWGISN